MYSFLLCFLIVSLLLNVSYATKNSNQELIKRLEEQLKQSQQMEINRQFNLQNVWPFNQTNIQHPKIMQQQLQTYSNQEHKHPKNLNEHINKMNFEKIKEF
ncbi:hypothetical protein Mgra_00008087 [Meloidogyne graminicola]|uniref:Uncharacterized protein n=1 Tax=Meloidogyne graminicola TaxID=189291 RepID=A0A8S9ZGP0_9BILA|nr:hypothetical protein Mgra_00008087 [Meloidogyne graminicola]